MRYLLRFASAVMFFLSGGWILPARFAAASPGAEAAPGAETAPRIIAANLDFTADQVFGQSDFISSFANKGGVNPQSLSNPTGVAFDPQGNLYVSDSANHRVLEYDAPLSADNSADRVFGQPDLSSSAINNGGISASSLSNPVGIALDAQGNLYVSDFGNSRVLEYDNPNAAPDGVRGDSAADRVFGQPDFTSSARNNGGISAHSLNFPNDVALDPQGNLYVVDQANQRVLEYIAPLSASTSPTAATEADRVFGQPNFTSFTPNNGGISAATLNIPEGVMVDAAGNLYVADTFNNRVLEYNTPASADTTADRVFGQPNFASGGTSSVSANSLTVPTDMTVDAHGNLYVADFSNSRVLEYDNPLTTNATADHVIGQPDFTSQTQNTGGISASSLGGPNAVIFDAMGNLYVSDEFNNRVLEYDLPLPYSPPTLNALSPAIEAAGGPTLSLTVNGSGYVSGSIVRWNGSDRPTTYLSSTQLVAVISASDVSAGGPFPVTVFTPTPGGGTSALINLGLYPRAGQDDIADVVLGQPNFTSNTINNPFMTGGSRLNSPGGAAVDTHSGRLFVADSGNHRVLSWPNAANLANGQAADLVIGQTTLNEHVPNNGGLSAKSLLLPSGVAVDAQGNLYVADTFNHRVLEYDAPLSSGMAANRVFGQGGSFTTSFGNNGGVSRNSLFFPANMAVDPQGNLYVADYRNNRVLEYNTPRSTDTSADQVFGQPDFTSNANNNGGSPSASSLWSPYSVALDSLGNLFVSDLANNRVLEFDTPLASGSDRAADRVYGQPGFTTNAANTGGIGPSSLFAPSNLALDTRGSLYVSDQQNNRVLEYDHPFTSGAADRVFGQPDFTSGGANTGGESAGSLVTPNGIAIDAHNNLYVVDDTNQRMLEYDWAFATVRLPFITR